MSATPGTVIQVGSRLSPGGQRGIQGIGAVLDVGSTETVRPIDPAEVTNSGTREHSVFDFKIPRGSHLAVGETETVVPSAPAEVFDTGTEGDVVINFKIPRAPQLEVGTVTTVLSNYEAEISQSTNEAGDSVLTFKIPRGAVGARGPSGDPPPCGSIFAYAGATAPEHYLICDGDEVLRDDYPELFEVIGETYGSGDGVETFNLPDLRSRCPVGIGPMDGTSTHNFTRGLKYGAPTHTLSAAEMPWHTHVVDNHYHVVDNHSHNVDVNHYHNTTTNDHNHGDPTHVHYAGGGWHDHGTHAHSYYSSTGQDNTGGGSNAVHPSPHTWLTTSANGVPANYGSNQNTGGAYAGLYNAGALGGTTWWMSDMSANWHIRGTDGRAPNTSWSAPGTSAAGGNVAHLNVPPSLGVNYIIKY